MSIFKKDLLFKMIEEGQIKSFTILGLPKQELVETYFNRKDLIKFLESKNIKCNILDEFDRTDIGIYFPSVGRKQYVDVCSITINKEVDEGEYNNILALFDEVLGYYQTDIPAKIINKILGLYKDEPFTFNDMLILMKDNQSEIARKIGKSRQLIADMKSGKAKIGIETLALLKREYPLLPWGEFIESFVNN
ncbi:TPA: helix-turn-helix transcriptional regulator [Clostridium botulinum]|uniref:helix-turn-helix domain-containing protein n=1 Tax=Clostridium TaxID=1485 RepID=UPI00077332D7|nr:MULTISPECIES: helix-turn-helix transcriptional regulator [Clostridium]APQ78769.1 helix-turn-helix family protein [Clostridium botulinum]AUM93718.1 transcriptional regulator [Clostridium sporogenes]MBN3355833.1 transcriptional regulator [Clostridium botulinum]HBJ2612791.1 helix-turn-helix transcriptional regulator [Clostridium botulinum]